ncbi:MAG: quinone oxidoreductase family protein [Actinoallomurus sp.]
MRRVRYYEYGGPEVLRVEEAEVPVPAAGQVLIRTEAIGANFVDTRFRRGAGGIFERPLPGALTGDVVGTVEAIGPEVGTTSAALAKSVSVGDRVAVLTEDAFADFVLADAEWLAPVPDGLDAGAASMLPMASPVALRVLRTGALAKGETVLIHAGAGGIGHMMVQLAKLLGAGTVIATAGSPAKLAFARELGADFAINYADADWPDQVRAVAPGGVDVIADSVGGETLLRGLELLAPFGRTVVYGLASGELPAVPVQSLFALRQVAGFSLLAWRTASPERARAEMTEVADHAVAGRLRTAVHATFPLTEVVKVHQLLDDRGQLGRVLVVP